MKTNVMTFSQLQKGVQEEIESQFVSNEETPQIQQWQQQGEEGEDGDVAENVDDDEQQPEEIEGEETEGGEEQEEESPYLVDEVNGLHGFEINVDYGDHDPDSVEGLYLRDLRMQEITRDDVIQEIASTQPEAYAFLLHLENGGSFANFKNVEQLPDVTSIVGNVDKSRSFVKRYLTSIKGLDQDEADAIIDQKIKNKELDNFTKKSHDEWDKIESRKVVDLEKEYNDSKRVQQDSFELLDEVTYDILETNKLTIRIPDTQKKEVAQSFYQNVVYLKGQLVYAVPIDNDNISGLIESNYLLNNKGVLQKMLGVKKDEQEIKTLRDKIKSKRDSTLDSAKGDYSNSENELVRRLKRNR